MNNDEQTLKVPKKIVCLRSSVIQRSLRSSARWMRPSADFFVPLMLFFGKIGRVASEEVVVELVKCKCLPILLYGLECCPLNKSDVKSLDFAVTYFLMKLFKSVNFDLINECRFCFNFSLPSELLEKRIAKFQKRYEGIGHIIRYFGKSSRNSHSTCKVWKKEHKFFKKSIANQNRYYIRPTSCITL